jgi:hypothetical protein
MMVPSHSRGMVSSLHRQDPRVAGPMHALLARSAHHRPEEGSGSMHQIEELPSWIPLKIRWVPPVPSVSHRHRRHSTCSGRAQRAHCTGMALALLCLVASGHIEAHVNSTVSHFPIDFGLEIPFKFEFNSNSVRTCSNLEI